MEPERNIEKLLRLFAAKRREQAREPLDLHPATRRQLTDEVARRYPASRAERPRSRLFVRLAFGFGAAAMVGLLAIVFFPESQHEEFSSLSMKGNEPPSASVPQAAAPQRAVDFDASVLNERSNAGVAGTAGAFEEELRAPALASEDALRSSALPAQDRTKVAPDSKTQAGNLWAAVNAPETPAIPGEIVNPQLGTSLYFFRYAQSTVSTTNPNLLSSFSVESRNGVSRIVESDGSVYQLASAGRSSRLGSASKGLADPETVTVTGTEEREQMLGVFEVRGTNRSLNQLLTFRGNLFFTNAFGGNMATGLPYFGIHGTAVLQSGLEMEVKALSTTPVTNPPTRPAD